MWNVSTRIFGYGCPDALGVRPKRADSGYPAFGFRTRICRWIYRFGHPRSDGGRGGLRYLARTPDRRPRYRAAEQELLAADHDRDRRPVPAMPDHARRGHAVGPRGGDSARGDRLSATSIALWEHLRHQTRVAGYVMRTIDDG